MTSRLLLVTCLLVACGGDDNNNTVTETCFGGSTECGGTCVSLASDQLNCGACGNACDATSVCTEGACVAVENPLTCPTGQMKCGEACKDTLVDSDNCGACGNICGPASSCSASACVTEIWEVLAATPDLVQLTDFSPTGQLVTYAASGTTFRSYAFPTTAEPLGVWADLAAAPIALDTYTSPTWNGTAVYAIQGTSVLKYDITGNTWTTPIDQTLTHSVADAQATHDDDGNLYVWASDQFLVVIKTSDDTATYVQGPVELPTSEPRSAWDTATKRLYLGDYDDPTGAFYAYNPADGLFTARATYPHADGFGDAFCSDRAGHVFATSSGSTDGADVWMYTAATNMWSQLPWLPTLHGSSSSCTVANGYLYFSNGDDMSFARLKL